MYETMVTVVGNLVDSPRLRRTGGGVDVANFRIASTARRYDRTTGSWSDHGTLFLGVSCWRRLGVNVTESLRRGDPVVVTGRLFAREYEINGQARTSFEIDAHAVGPDLSRGTAVFRRAAASPAADTPEPVAAVPAVDGPGPGPGRDGSGPAGGGPDRGPDRATDRGSDGGADGGPNDPDGAPEGAPDEVGGAPAGERVRSAA